MLGFMHKLLGLCHTWNTSVVYTIQNLGDADTGERRIFTCVANVREY